MTIVKPPRLKKGDLIGLVSPASTIADPTRIDRGVSYLERLGYRVIVGQHVLKVNGYLAGTDAERVEDLHRMFGNTEVKAVWCIRGGYGTPRILRHLDYRLLRQNPKIFVGYSDITTLQMAIFRRTGLVTFHGPMLGVDMAGQMETYSEERLWQVLTSTTRAGRIPLPAPGPLTLAPGRATGRMLGGNLALLQSIMGSRYLPDLDGALLYVEDLGEEPYRVDRMFVHLLNAGVFAKVKGLMVGQFTDCEPKDPSKPSLSLDHVIGEAAAYAGVPVLGRLPFGHDDVKLTIPVGIRGRIDATEGTLEFLEPAVR
jgi:muramoyltetrapeptide carboxypeptidase